MEQTALKRESYFDNAKFILIFLVVFGHFSPNIYRGLCGCPCALYLYLHVSHACFRANIRIFR